MRKSSRNRDAPREPSRAVRPIHPARSWLIGLVYFLALAPLSFAPKLSGNVSSRYMTIEGIVERGTLAVESSPQRAGSGSPDLVRFGRHLYSDKPPVLPALGSVVYFPLYWSGIRFTRSPAQFLLVNWVLVVSVVGVASALVLVWLRRLLQVVPIAPWAADLLTLAFGFASPLLTYGVTFNNHSVAAALITGALALVVLEDPVEDEAGKTKKENEEEKTKKGRGTRHRIAAGRALAGALAGLAATIDLPAGGVLLVALAVWLAARGPRVPWTFLAGASLPLTVHCVLQSLITGTPLPVEMYPEAFDYPGSYWATEGAWKETGPRWRFGLELLFGPQGWVTVTPVLAFSAIGLGLAAIRGDEPVRSAARAVGGMTLVLLLYYTWGVRRTDFAGLSFGTRHLLPIAPACYLFAVWALSWMRRRLAWAVFLVFTAVGAVYAVEGLRDPWSRIERRAPADPALRMLQRFVLYPWSSYHR